jgi:hypothetical protein
MNNTTPNTVHANTTSVSTRHYSFALPVTLSAFYTSMAPGYLQQKGIWADLPVSFQWLIYNASQKGESVTITKAELDQISDAHWQHIQPLLSGMV